MLAGPDVDDSAPSPLPLRRLPPTYPGISVGGGGTMLGSPGTTVGGTNVAPGGIVIFTPGPGRSVDSGVAGVMYAGSRVAVAPWPVGGGRACTCHMIAASTAR